MSEERMRAAVRRWRAGSREGGRTDEVVMGPTSAYEAVTRQMVEQLGREIGEVKARLNGLIFTVVGAMVVDVALRLAGT